ncbi:MAG: 1-acyl-sn-glycerol-3-phosphate acyltransferase, partial [Gemmatimonadota bacterium]
LSYYKIGYNVSRALTGFFYKVTVGYQDEAALSRIPKRDVVVYLMNHRSNADYVLVTVVLARVVSISYAVGEWARTWPLEYIFKSFGSYFIRRRFREPLYHTVLERFIHLITKNGVTQGIFPEGGLTRDGALRPPKIGLLDYIVRTTTDPDFDGDVWLVPVGINYDRVFEDRSLTKELIVGGARPSRLGQFLGVLSFIGANLGRLLTGQLKRYGRAAVNFGTPLSVRSWLITQPSGVLDLPKADRLPYVQRLAQAAMDRVGAVIPVTPVPLGALALVSFHASVIAHDALLERLDYLRDQLTELSAKIVRSELTADEVWDRAWRTFRMRRWLLRDGPNYVVLPEARPLLEYYANSIRHLMSNADGPAPLTPAHGPDLSLPRLGPQAH